MRIVAIAAGLWLGSISLAHAQFDVSAAGYQRWLAWCHSQGGTNTGGTTSPNCSIPEGGSSGGTSVAPSTSSAATAGAAIGQALGNAFVAGIQQAQEQARIEAERRRLEAEAAEAARQRALANQARAIQNANEDLRGQLADRVDSTGVAPLQYRSADQLFSGRRPQRRPPPATIGQRAPTYGDAGVAGDNGATPTAAATTGATGGVTTGGGAAAEQQEIFLGGVHPSQAGLEPQTTDASATASQRPGVQIRPTGQAMQDAFNTRGSGVCFDTGCPNAPTTAVVVPTPTARPVYTPRQISAMSARSPAFGAAQAAFEAITQQLTRQRQLDASVRDQSLPLQGRVQAARDLQAMPNTVADLERQEEAARAERDRIADTIDLGNDLQFEDPAAEASNP